jgi:glycerol-1-phosphate dehydrogenase [NAD(P)+]
VPLLGRMMPTPIRTDIGAGSLARLGDLLLDPRISASGRVVYLVDVHATRLQQALDGVVTTSDNVMRVEGGSLPAAADAAQAVADSHYDAIVGVGGGALLDTAKFVASRVGLPMVSVAANLAHDGIASPVAVLVNNGRRASFGVPMPVAVVVDTDIVRQGNPRLLRAGIGDVLSNLTSVEDWRLAHARGSDSYDGMSASLARVSAEAVLHHPGGIQDEDFLRTLAEALLMSGLAMAGAGSSRPCSGACHEISHAIDFLLPQKSSPHGEQVGVGALVSAHLQRNDALFGQMLAALRRHEMPTSPADLGLSTEEFIDAVTYAPQTRPARITVLEVLDLSPEDVRAEVTEVLRRIAA